MELTQEEISNKLYKTAKQLYNAGLLMKDLDEKISLRFLKTADKLLSIIPEDCMINEKISEEKINSILNEIFNIECE